MRPVVPLRIGDLEPTAALVDSGALGIRVDARLGRAAGFDLTAGVPDGVTIAGDYHSGVRLIVPLRVGRWSWEAPVTFLDPWPHSHQVLGIDGFFDHFTVRFEAAEEALFLTRR